METHRFSVEKNETSYCGDHYCGGHTYYTVRCTCEWEFKYQYASSREEAVREHKEDVLEAAHGIRFEWEE